MKPLEKDLTLRTLTFALSLQLEATTDAFSNA